MKETLNKTWFVDIDGTILYHNSNDNLDDIIEKHGSKSHLQEKPINSGIEKKTGQKKIELLYQQLAKKDILIIH